MEASKLNLILEQHKLFLDGKGGKRADLRGANLTGANLGGANLLGANLTGANLTGANLTDAFLEGAFLEFANLTGANLKDAKLRGAKLWSANLTGANLTGANLTGAYLFRANLSNAILPDISWIIPGCLAHLNNIMDELYLEKENKLVNFVQDSFGFIIQNNGAEGTFDMLVEDRIIRNIPDWLKYTGLKQIASV